MVRRRRAFWSAALALAGTLGFGCSRAPTLPPDLAVPAPFEGAMTASQGEAVRHLVRRRCAVCHACYDAPCQLVLSSREGLWRGAHKDPVYRSSRLRAADPTRLGLDAQTPEGWRKLGFFSVTESGPDSMMSLVLAMLALGEAHDFAPDEPLPEAVSLDLDRSLSCPRPDELGAYAAQQPLGGMPYGMASLSAREYDLLGAWAASDAPAPPPPPLPADLVEEAAAWEQLLNQTSLKHRVVARYLFEHWVFANFYFSAHPEGPFFEIVRSATPPGAPIDVIATRFPYDDPGAEPFWYRLRRIESAVVHKTHITYGLGPARRERLHELFLAGDWEPTRFPSWEPKQASNPFVSFEEIPARARYEFLLDDAAYFVRTFIRGPVCRGQAATDVIQDRFFVAFLDPDHDVSIVDPSFLPDVKHDLRLPAEAGENLPLFKSWARYDRAQKRYRDRRAQAYRSWLGDRGASLDFVWDGDGRNRNALLTVFRHNDNASVVQGFVGAIPKTAWVMDYPIFERIYYDLVAGFDVFGNVGHQLGVRLYMDNLRMESEDLFLVLLPEPMREDLRASWYIGATRQLKYTLVNKLRSQGFQSDIEFQTDDPKAEVIEMLWARSPKVSGPPDLLNRCGAPLCERTDATLLERTAERAFRRLSAAQGAFAVPLPDIALVRVRGKGNEAVVYTLVHDKSHTNVAAIFREEARRQPELDRVTVVPGILGSYPNFAFDVPVDEIESFVDAILKLSGPTDLTALAERFGVRRSSPRFWSTFDWMQDELIRQDPREAGILDLNRYQNL